MTKAFEKHNHKKCTRDLLKRVEARSREEGLRLTDARKRVLQILLESHHAMGAYDILSRLTQEGAPAQPPIVYRALEFLTEHGFAHKVECLNAYIACQFPDEEHNPGFLICRRCETVGEAQVDCSVIEASDFQIEEQVIEAGGVCANCQKEVRA